MSKVLGEKASYRVWVKLIAVTLLTIGIFFRFANIDKKVYSYDETHTSLRVAGYTFTEIFEDFKNDKISTIEDLQKYQQLSPEKSGLGTIRGLIEEEPQHPPLYFLLLRIWGRFYGDSVESIRTFSALISLLAFPAIYWLSLELFDSTLVGWISVLLLASSPFHVLYAQEARQYSLWTVGILLSSAVLLRALRKRNKLYWRLYALSLSASFYTFPFTAFVMVGHGLYVMCINGFRMTRLVVNYLLSALTGFLSFSPWLIIMALNYSTVEESTPWSTQNVGIKALLKGWSFSFASIFYDTNIDWWGSCSTRWWQYLPIFIVLPLIGFSIYFLLRYSPRSSLFILFLTGTIFVFLALPDVILGGRRSLMARYLIPSYLGVELAVAYLFASKLRSISPRHRSKMIWQWVLAILVSVGIFSCAISYHADNWWNKYNDPLPKAAEIINDAEAPLLVIEAGSTGTLMALSHRVKSDVKVHFLLSPYSFKIPEDISNIFLVSPSHKEDYLAQFAKGGKTVQQVDASWCIPTWGGLWKISP